jgi:hypothetical protein
MSCSIRTYMWGYMCTRLEMTIQRERLAEVAHIPHGLLPRDDRLHLKSTASFYYSWYKAGEIRPRVSTCKLVRASIWDARHRRVVLAREGDPRPL